MRKISILLTALLIVTTASAQSVITGVWNNKNSKNNNIALYKIRNGMPEMIATSIVNGNGEFGFVLFNAAPGFYQIGLNPRARTFNYSFYLKPNDRFSATFSGVRFSLNGTENSPENKEMARWSNEAAAFDSTLFYQRVATYVDFFPVLNKIVESNNNYRLENPTDNNFTQRFADFRINQIRHGALHLLYTPRSAHPKETEIPEFYSGLSLANLNNSIFDCPNGNALLHLLKTKSDLALGKSLQKRPSTGQMLDNALPQLKTDELKGEYVLLSVKSMKTFDEISAVKNKFGKYLNTGDVEQRFNEFMISKASLAKGETAVDFKFGDINGKEYALSDFKGKAVYIDVWATWCVPCRKELPHLKELHEKFKDNRNIEFVSISTDAGKDFEKWKNMITNDKMPGIQLFAGDNRDVIMKPYEIKAIPRFILIGKDGKIVTVDAPRPSSSEIVPLLNSIAK